MAADDERLPAEGRLPRDLGRRAYLPGPAERRPGQNLGGRCRGANRGAAQGDNSPGKRREQRAYVGDNCGGRTAGQPRGAGKPFRLKSQHLRGTRLGRTSAQRRRREAREGGISTEDGSLTGAGPWGRPAGEGHGRVRHTDPARRRVGVRRRCREAALRRRPPPGGDGRSALARRRAAPCDKSRW